jgi:hypothetical protein
MYRPKNGPYLAKSKRGCLEFLWRVCGESDLTICIFTILDSLPSWLWGFDSPHPLQLVNQWVTSCDFSEYCQNSAFRHKIPTLCNPQKSPIVCLGPSRPVASLWRISTRASIRDPCSDTICRAARKTPAVRYLCPADGACAPLPRGDSRQLGFTTRGGSLKSFDHRYPVLVRYRKKTMELSPPRPKARSRSHIARQTPSSRARARGAKCLAHDRCSPCHRREGSALAEATQPGSRSGRPMSCRPCGNTGGWKMAVRLGPLSPFPAKNPL